MSIVPHAPIRPAWCAPDGVELVGRDECWFSSEVHTVEPVDSLPDDPDLVEVFVDQHVTGRGLDGRETRRTLVRLNTVRETGSCLTAHEARRAARLLLAAADIADGVAVTW